MNPLPSQALWAGAIDLLCLARREETHDTATFELKIPPANGPAFLAGQFISINVQVDGESLWRAYSISSSPQESSSLSITVRRVEGGRVSNWLLDHWRAGMSLPALAPAGSFCLRGDGIPAKLAFFSAGSGITPLMSMTRWLLQIRAQTEIHFFHSARSEEDFIFRSELQDLVQQHANLHLHLFLTRPQGKIDCYPQRLDEAHLKALLPMPADLQAWLCGAQAYMDDVTHWLQSAGLAEGCIFQESFTPSITSVQDDAAQYQLELPAWGKSLAIAEGESLLDVMEREGLPIIGACRTGVCGSCKCKLEAGQVESSSALPLSAAEIDAGYVLACSTVARSDLVLAL